ncbi:hypothetical protein UA08_07255 [Talaromyces atroroseus]|uniref:Uncharacterized protein n=1 Tax=Talaromyces atroroseus TaxID=1441469 RepID=A0A225AK40_TALAT|nr:hypothetical protein UA08_07255 [Talaromyces atroroseus]OKL57568.1 hypothetical protein UA08_07255 [Talaromyces atroroseus]
MCDSFSDPNCLPSLYYQEGAELLDFSSAVGFSFEAWGVPEKRGRENTLSESSSKPTKTRVRLPESSAMDMNITKRDPEFDMWCIDDLRNPRESGASTQTIWKSWEEAQKHAWTVVEYAPQPSGTDIPEDEDSKRAIVAAIKSAMWSTAYALDGKDTINCHYKNRRDLVFEYHAWKLLDLLIKRHRFGQLEFFEPVQPKTSKVTSRSPTFNERLHDVLHTLTAHKSIVKRIIARPASRVFIDDPMSEGARVLANRKLNEKRGIQIAQAKKARYSV